MSIAIRSNYSLDQERVCLALGIVFRHIGTERRAPDATVAIAFDAFVSVWEPV
jgi:hypothetical protein